MGINNKRAIEKPALHINKLKEYFKENSTFNTKDIEQFYHSFEPGIASTTVNWRIYALVQSGIISRIGRGKFTIGKGRIFLPQPSAKLKILSRDLQKQFPYMQTCIWNTSVLNELMLHQPGRFYTMIEVDKETTQSVFYFLKETKKNIFLEPNAEILSLYASAEKDTIIINSLVSEAPVQMLQGVLTTTIEKLLVDVFCDDVLFAAQHGSEMETIFKEAFEKYTINENKMLRYADRRRKKKAFSNYLNRVSKFRQVW